MRPFAMLRDSRGLFWVFVNGRCRMATSRAEAFALVEQMTNRRAP